MDQIRKSCRKKKQASAPPGFVMTITAALLLAVTTKLLLPAGAATFDSSLWAFSLKGDGDLAAYVVVFLLLLFAVRLLSRFGHDAKEGGDQP